MSMKRLKRLVPVLALAAAAAALWPAAGSASIFRGTVVASQHGTLLVASPSGTLRAVPGHARLGSRVTLGRGHPIVVGRTDHATIRGIVVRRIGATLVLSSNHHLIAIPNRVGRRLAAAAQTPTSTPGAVVTTDVSIRNGTIEEDDETEVGQVNAATLFVQATIKAVGPGTVTLDVQGQSVTLRLPAGLTLPASLVNQTVTINVSLSSDDDQGDVNDDDGGGNDNSGSGGGGGDDD
jgi:hypothetical protein